jgi:hypothetical protein
MYRFLELLEKQPNSNSCQLDQEDVLDSVEDSPDIGERNVGRLNNVHDTGTMRKKERGWEGDPPTPIGKTCVYICLHMYACIFMYP